MAGVRFDFARPRSIASLVVPNCGRDVKQPESDCFAIVRCRNPCGKRLSFPGRSLTPGRVASRLERGGAAYAIQRDRYGSHWPQPHHRME